MSTPSPYLENELFEGKLKSLAKNALQHFNQSPSNNIYISEDQTVKIVKLLNKDETPVYFLLAQVLGAGAFGEVSKGVLIDLDKETIAHDTQVAIKITDFTQAGTVGSRDIPELRNETIHENNILKMIDQSFGFSIGSRTKRVEIPLEDGTDVTLTKEAVVQEAIVAMPLFPGRDIQHKIHENKFSYGSITSIELASNLSRDLKTLHEKNIIHSDLKPANVIWDTTNGSSRIVDFNKAKILPLNEYYVKDSSSSDKEYMAPECFTAKKGYQFSQASDVFSLGKILAEKFNMTTKLTSESMSEQQTLQNKPYLSYDQLIIKEFINKMMSPEEQQRPTTENCVNFFSTLEKKMKLDLDTKRPDYQTRLAINKKLIGLETYANQLRKEISNSGTIDVFLSKQNLTADKGQKLRHTLEAINFLTTELSKEKIDAKKIEQKADILLENDKKASGIFSFKGRYNNLISGLKDSIKKNDEKSDNSFGRTIPK